MGLGIYYPAEGARLLRASPENLRRWARGYTYWTPGHRARSKVGSVIRTDLPTIRGQRALSFLELMELRVVAALRRRGISLQRIRAAAGLARVALGSTHPFATRQILTDGKRIFAQTQPPPDDHAIIELSKDRHTQLIIAGIIEPFLEGLDFDESSGIALRWWPLGKNRPIVLDPAISFGAPTILGTRVRTDVVAGIAAVESVEAAARAYDVPTSHALAATDFERELRAA